MLKEASQEKSKNKRKHNGNIKRIKDGKEEKDLCLALKQNQSRVFFGEHILYFTAGTGVELHLV